MFDGDFFQMARGETIFVKRKHKQTKIGEYAKISFMKTRFYQKQRPFEENKTVIKSKF